MKTFHFNVRCEEVHGRLYRWYEIVEHNDGAAVKTLREVCRTPRVIGRGPDADEAFRKAGEDATRMLDGLNQKQIKGQEIVFANGARLLAH